MRKYGVVFLSLFLLVGMAVPVNAAMYMKIDGIDGESTDAEHDKWIDVLSIDWGMHKPGGGSTGQSRRRGDVVLEDFEITKEIDSTTPKLVEPMCNADQIKEVVIHLCTSTEGMQHCYMEYVLSNAHISNYQVSGSDSDQVPTEHVSLNFENIKVSYTPNKERGEIGEPSSAMCEKR